MRAQPALRRKRADTSAYVSTLIHVGPAPPELPNELFTQLAPVSILP